MTGFFEKYAPDYIEAIRVDEAVGTEALPEDGF
jgi:hypothetical protein